MSKFQTIIDIVYETIKKYNMLESGDKVVVGVSGGADSLCLLHLLNQLSTSLEIKLRAAHLNHGIRGVAADRDEKFVEGFAKELGIPVYTKHIDIKEYAKQNRMTVEEAGREARYSFFEEVLVKSDADKIAVGHNKNDNIETFLLNLLRGSGMEGLKGIEPDKGKIIRPLIRVSRQEIEEYCGENSLNFRTDETNTETIYTRNKVRINLIPYLKDNFNPNIIDSLNRTAELIYDDNEFLNSLSYHNYEDCLISAGSDMIWLDVKKFNRLHGSIKRRVLRIAIEKVKGSLKAVQKNHIDQAVNLAEKVRTGTGINIPKDIMIRIEYGKLVISTVHRTDEIQFSRRIPIPGEIEIPELSAVLRASIVKPENAGKIAPCNKEVCMLDYQKIGGELFVRNKRNGDVIRPSGMKGRKKLKDYFIDEKVPREQRIRVPLVTIGNEVVWIVGMRFSEEFKVTNHTKEVLVLEYGNKQ